jgi:hypothetical protein
MQVAVVSRRFELRVGLRDRVLLTLAASRLAGAGLLVPAVRCGWRNRRRFRRRFWIAGARREGPFGTSGCLGGVLRACLSLGAASR